MDAVEDAVIGPEEQFIAPRRSRKAQEEDIEKLLVDESLSDVERYTQFLNPSADPAQFRFAVCTLPSLVREHGREAFLNIADTLANAFKSFDSDLTCCLADAFWEIATENLLPCDDQASMIAPYALKGMKRAKDGEVEEAWEDVVVAVMPHLSQETLEDDLVGFASMKGSIEQGPQARAIACKLIGSLALHISPDCFFSKLEQRVVFLCQDTDSEVRACMAGQLANIASLVGPSGCESFVLPEIEELSKDEESYVRAVTLTTLVNLLDHLSQDGAKNLVLPLIHRCLDDIADPDHALHMANRLQGLFDKLTTLKFSANCFVKPWEIMGQSKDPEVRRLVAEATPSVIKAVGAKNYAQAVHETFAALASDYVAKVRAECGARCAAVGELIGGERSHKFLRPIVMKLLQDVNSAAPDKLLPNMATVASQLKVNEEGVRARVGMELVGTLSEIEQRCRGKLDWRGRKHVLSALGELVDSVPEEKLFEVIAPLCVRCLDDGAMPLKEEAENVLCRVMRHCTRSHRRELGYKVVRDYARSKSYWHRAVYVSLCRKLMENFSAKHFREHFLPSAIDLLADPVANVRLTMCQLMPELRRRVRLSEDAQLFERLYHLATQRTADSDPLVVHVANEAYASFKSIGDFSKQPAAWLEHERKKEEAEEAEREEPSANRRQPQRKSLDSTRSLRQTTTSQPSPAVSGSTTTSSGSSTFARTSLAHSSSFGSGSSSRSPRARLAATSSSTAPTRRPFGAGNRR